MSRSPRFRFLLPPSLLLLIGSLALGYAERAAAQEEGESRSVVRVSGESTVSVAPDLAVVEIGVVTESDSAQEAATENARKLDATLGELRRAVGSSGRIRTQSYSLNPRYEYPREGGRQRKLVGYEAANVVQVKTSKLDQVGRIIDAATASGANRIQQLRFELKNEEAVRAEALRNATLRARSKAEAIAAALDLRILRVVSVEESGAPAVPVLRHSGAMAAEAAPTTPVEPGTIDVRAGVVLEVEVGS